MDDQVNKIIDFIKLTLSELDRLNRNEVFSTTTTLDSILIRHYDKSVAYKQDLTSIRQGLGLLISSNTDKPPIGFSLEDVKGWYITLLKAMISELELLGLPSTNDVKIDKSINVSVNQNQNQTQVVDLFLDAIRNEITGKQLTELKAIITNEPNIESAKSKLLSKLKDFGIDICSNIIANIITNPIIWGGL
jgi:hypothetical protein